jgi:hypothetical protein
MNKPVPSPVMPATPGREPAPARLDQGHARSGSVSVNVRYYKSMKPNRVYPLVVELPRATAKPTAGSNSPLVVKPVVAGAVVTPSEQAMELTPSGGEATFHVTPVAKGRLTDARVELSQQGRRVDAVPLKMKAKTQRMTWILLLMTLIIPAVLAYYTNIAPLSGDVPRMGIGQVMKHQIPAGGGGGDQPAPRPQGGPPLPAPPEAPDPSKGQVVRMIPGTPGEVLQYKVSSFLHRNLPGDKIETSDYIGKDIDLSSFNKTKDNYVVSEDTYDTIEYVSWWIGDKYQYLYASARDIYPAFILAIGLAGLTLLSLVAHRAYRGKTSRSGIRLLEGLPGNPARSGGAREGMPVVLEAAD